MSPTWRCRQCHCELARAAHLRLPSSLRGMSALCLTCTDRLMEKFHVQQLHEFVPRYLKDQQQETPIRALQQEVKELRALLDEMTRPNP